MNISSFEIYKHLGMENYYTLYIYNIRLIINIRAKKEIHLHFSVQDIPSNINRQ